MNRFLARRHVAGLHVAREGLAVDGDGRPLGREVRRLQRFLAFDHREVDAVGGVAVGDEERLRIALFMQKWLSFDGRRAPRDHVNESRCSKRSKKGGNRTAFPPNSCGRSVIKKRAPPRKPR